MRKITAVLLVTVFTCAFVSCKKDDVAPVGAQSNGTLLAGAKGSSKSWTLVSFSGSVNGGAVQQVTIDPCVGDNVYKFMNNDGQTFEHSEGLSKCSSLDSAIVESGSWAFTLDGKRLVIDGSSFSQQSILTVLGTPLDVASITDGTMKLTFSLSSGGSQYSYSMQFSRK